MKTLYIDGPDNGGPGQYYLIGDKGEFLAAHFCSCAGYAPGDLEARRPERQRAWREEFGEYRVLFLGDDEMTRDELRRLNHERAEVAA